MRNNENDTIVITTPAHLLTYIWTQSETYTNKTFQTEVLTTA